MADSKLADLTADASPTGDDLVYVVNDPGGTPADRKVTLTNLAASAPFTGKYVQEADTDASAWGFVIDEDDMASNSATKVPTQQSVKVYTDAIAGGLLVSGSTALTNHTPSNTTMEQWGTEEATIAQASAPASAVVLAWLTGSAGSTEATPSGSESGEFRLEVSFNGGGTWATMGDSGIITTVASSGGAGRRIPLSATGRATGAVTGDVQVRVMCRDVTTAGDLIFADGHLVVVAHPS